MGGKREINSLILDGHVESKFTSKEQNRFFLGHEFTITKKFLHQTVLIGIPISTPTCIDIDICFNRVAPK